LIDALLAALPDQAYFEQRDFGSSMRETLLASEEPYGCYLHGAKVWDLSKHPDYPFYSVCKTNTVDNTVFIPFRNATVVLSSIVTGELILESMREDDGKMPLIEQPKPKTPRPGIPRAKTYETYDMWRTISAHDLSGGTGSYLAFLHAGNFQSDAFGFRVISDKAPPPTSPFESLLTAKSGGESKGRSIPGVQYHPVPGLEAPSTGGLTFRTGKPSMHNGLASMPVECAFRFIGSWKGDWVRLPLHVMAAEAGSDDPDANVIWLPREKMIFKDGTYSGTFSFDLADFFTPLPGQKPKIPPSAWVSFVHRNWHGPITRVDFGAH
jgi:hypothetical protein